MAGGCGGAGASGGATGPPACHAGRSAPGDPRTDPEICRRVGGAVRRAAYCRPGARDRKAPLVSAFPARASCVAVAAPTSAPWRLAAHHHERALGRGLKEGATIELPHSRPAAVKPLDAVVTLLRRAARER